jgi:HK97 gp10 family phage protein
MAITVEVRGLRELRAKMQQVNRDLRNKGARRAIGTAAGLVKRTVVSGAPVRSGTLRRAALVNYRRKESTDTRTVYVVTFRRGKRYQPKAGKSGKLSLNRDAYYAGWVEFGHRIVPRRHKSAKHKRSVATGRVEGRHMLRDGFVRSVSPALAVITKELTEFFAKV